MRALALGSVLALGLGSITAACQSSGDPSVPDTGKADETAPAKVKKSPPLGTYEISHTVRAGQVSMLELKPSTGAFKNFTGEYNAVLHVDEDGAVVPQSVSGPYRVYRRKIRFEDSLISVKLLAIFDSEDTKNRLGRWVVGDMTDSGFLALQEIEDGKLVASHFLDFIASGNGTSALNLECELEEVIDGSVFEEGLDFDNEATGISVFRNPTTGVIEVDVGDHSWNSSEEQVELTSDSDRHEVVTDFGDGFIVKVSITEGGAGRIEATFDGDQLSDVATITCE